jgi:5S rRNA maturation endonuclease (ribonuclease M5)
MEGCTVRDAALKIQSWFDVAASNERPENYVPSRDRPKTKKLATERKNVGGEKAQAKPPDDTGSDEEVETVNEPLEFQLKSVDMEHPYIQKRGLKCETAEYFGVGFFHGRGSMSERVVIPIHDADGALIAYAGRSVDDGEPKYKLPAGFKKSLVLFNLHRVLKAKSREVIIVEGFFDCMKVFQAGFPSVVSLMGSALSEHQEKLLIDNFDRAVMMLDSDEGGRSAASQIAARLMRKMYVRVVDVVSGTQPDSMSSDEIRKLLAFLDPKF